jgi:PAS domain S-box-containing protein
VERRFKGGLSPFKIAVIYALVGALWILFSDRLLTLLASDPTTITRLQTLKGWLYVTVTAWMLYALIRRNIGEIHRSAEALRESEERYRSLTDDVLDSSAVGILILDPDFKIAWVNRSLERYFGIQRKEIVGKDKRQLICERIKYIFEDPEGFAEKVLAAYDNNTYIENFECHVLPDGERKERWLEHWSQPIRSGLYAGGRIEHYYDITERKRAEQALHRKVNDLAALYEASQVFLGQIDARTTLENVCRLAVERFGLKMAWVGLVAEGDFEVHPASAYGFEEGYLDSIHVTWDDSPTGRGPTGTAIRTGQAVAMNRIETDPAYEPWRTAAIVRNYRSSAALPLCYGDEVLGALNVYSAEPEHFTADRLQVLQSLANLAAVGLQKARLYEQVQRYAAELEQRVAERTAELQKSNFELEAFSYSVSHDLRAPLRAMQGFALALLEDYAERLDHIGRNYAQRIVAAAQRMDALIHDLLDYSRLSRSEMQLQPVNLEWIIDEVLKQLELEIRGKDAEITVRKPMPQVTGHHATLVQVVGNLLSNAVKFVASGVQPQVRVWAEEHSRWVRLWVKDNGIGIAPEHHERIFRVFERLHGVETYPGTGIGLAIVRKGIERMGGRVGVESTPGQGSRFWVELPKAKEG